jgi:hypothetical protein
VSGNADPRRGDAAADRPGTAFPVAQAVESSVVSQTIACSEVCGGWSASLPVFALAVDRSPQADRDRCGPIVSTLAVTVGAVLLLVVLVDLAWTALGVSYGSGPLTKIVLRVGWRAASPLRGFQARGWQAAAGVATVLATLASWVVLLWVAWSLIFLGASHGVVDRSGAAADGWDRVYFAGYSLFTLGNGEFRPDGAIWQVMTVLAALSGLTVVSLAIAYLVLVTSAAADRHAVAVQISLLGPTPTAVAAAWATAPDATQFDASLRFLAAPIVELTQRHLAYPVLHFFHSADPRSSPPVTIAVLDDALTLLLWGLAPASRPTGPGTTSVRRALDDYVDMVGGQYGDLLVEPPDLVLDGLAATGAAVVSRAAFAGSLCDLAPRRSALYQVVAAEGFTPSADNRQHRSGTQDPPP